MNAKCGLQSAESHVRKGITQFLFRATALLANILVEPRAGSGAAQQSSFVGANRSPISKMARRSRSMSSRRAVIRVRNAQCEVTADASAGRDCQGQTLASEPTIRGSAHLIPFSRRKRKQTIFISQGPNASRLPSAPIHWRRYWISSMFFSIAAAMRSVP